MLLIRNPVLLTETVDSAKEESVRKELSVSNFSFKPPLHWSLNLFTLSTVCRGTVSQAKEENLRLIEKNIEDTKRKQSAFEMQINQLREQKVRKLHYFCVIFSHYRI